jgi:hypothetical protein
LRIKRFPTDEDAFEGIQVVLFGELEPIGLAVESRKEVGVRLNAPCIASPDGI